MFFPRLWLHNDFDEKILILLTSQKIDADDDDLESDEDMMGDEAVDSDDDEYDEDIDESEADDEETWNKLSTPKLGNSIDLAASTSTTPKSTDTASSTPSMIDPYFTHFDPRSEHQSYKVQTTQQTFSL